MYVLPVMFLTVNVAGLRLLSSEKRRMVVALALLPALLNKMPNGM